MDVVKFEMQTEIIGTETHTFEIKRVWNPDKTFCLILELYPTISVNTSSAGCMDLSTMHLLNHIAELGDFGRLSVCNIFSKIFSKSKPLANELQRDKENIDYIKKLLEKEIPRNSVIILAWGNSLETHRVTRAMKLEILKIIKESGFEKQIKALTTPEFEKSHNGRCNLFHPLFLGIRAREQWTLNDLSLDNVMKELIPEEIKNKTQKRRKKNVQAKNNAGL